ncbi:hypothetical protein D3C72_1705850 [compost metagenome]
MHLQAIEEEAVVAVHRKRAVAAGGQGLRQTIESRISQCPVGDLVGETEQSLLGKNLGIGGMTGTNLVVVIGKVEALLSQRI